MATFFNPQTNPLDIELNAFQGDVYKAHAKTLAFRQVDKASIFRCGEKRFIEAAREAGCSEDEAEIRENMKRIAKAKKPKPE